MTSSHRESSQRTRNTSGLGIWSMDSFVMERSLTGLQPNHNLPLGHGRPPGDTV